METIYVIIKADKDVDNNPRASVLSYSNELIFACKALEEIAIFEAYGNSTSISEPFYDFIPGDTKYPKKIFLEWTDTEETVSVPCKCGWKVRIESCINMRDGEQCGAPIVARYIISSTSKTIYDFMDAYTEADRQLSSMGKDGECYIPKKCK